MSGSAERIAQNESIFRSVNEAIAAQIFREPYNDEGPWLFLCECAEVACTARIELTVSEYRRARAGAARFAVLPEHVDADHERVVERSERFTIVEKTGAAGDAAARLLES